MTRDQESTGQTHLQLLKLRPHCSQSLILSCVLALKGTGDSY